MAFTLDRAVGVKLFDWTGSVGDAALLFVFGYAAGALLQALGKAVIESPWLWIRGGQPTATLLMPASKKLSANAKGDALEALRSAHGELPLGEEERQELRDRILRLRRELTRYAAVHGDCGGEVGEIPAI